MNGKGTTSAVERGGRGDGCVAGLWYPHARACT